MLLMPPVVKPLQHCAPDQIRYVIRFSPRILGGISILDHVQPPGRQNETSQLVLNPKFHAGPKSSTTATFNMNEHRFNFGAQELTIFCLQSNKIVF